MGSSIKLGPFRVLFIRVPYYIWWLKKGPYLENYPYYKTVATDKGLGFRD